MNKYSNKIVAFINNNFSKLLSHTKNNKFSYNNNFLITHIRELYQTKNKHYDKSKIELIKLSKLHDINEPCIIYLIFKDLIDDGLIESPNNFDNYNNFYNWYRVNFKTFDIKKILLKYNHINKYKQYYEILYNPIEDRIELHNLIYNNSFISLDIIHHIESSELFRTKYIYEDKNNYNNIKLTLYEFNQITHYDEDINEIINIILLTTKLFKINNRTININLILSEQKKYLYPNQEYISTDNVNSGATTTYLHYSNNDNIIIWRKEEYIKVLIHELIHLYGVDFHSDDTISNKITPLFNSRITLFDNNKDAYSESYVESLAIIINSVVKSVINDTNFDEIITYEILFGYFQVSKILYHMNKNIVFNIDTKINLKQLTSVASYYFIKLMFLSNLDIFLEYLNNNSFFIKQNENRFISLYKQSLYNYLKPDIINMMIDFIKGYKNDDFIIKTMRMSVYG